MFQLNFCLTGEGGESRHLGRQGDEAAGHHPCQPEGPDGVDGVGGEEDQPGRHQHLSQGLANNRSVNELIFIVCFLKRSIFQPKSILVSGQ